MSDHKMRDYLQPLPADLLLQVAQGLVDVQRLAADEMAARGLGLAGEWMGFDKARELWEVDQSSASGIISS